MLTFFTIIHILLCVFMVFVILLQPGKDAGMGAALGGGAATSAFGGRGAVTFLSKVTAICAGLFFLTSLGLSFVGLRSSVADKVAAAAAKQQPPPAPPAPAPGTTPAPAAPAPAEGGAAKTGIEQGSGAAAPTTPAPATPGPTGNTAPPPAPAPQK